MTDTEYRQHLTQIGRDLGRVLDRALARQYREEPAVIADRLESGSLTVAELVRVIRTHVIAEG